MRTTTLRPTADAAVGGSVISVPESGRRPRRRTPTLSWKLRLIQLMILAAWLVAWELVVRNKLLPVTLNKSPLDVWNYLWGAFSSGELPRAIGASMKAVVIAFVLAAITGGPFGIALALLPRFEQALAPFLDAINAMPRVTLGPLFVALFGIGLDAKVALAFSLCFFMMFANARTGAQSADPEVVWLSTALGAKKWQIFLKVYLPAALPGVFAGLRLSLIFAFFGVTASELLASTDGLGNLVETYSNQFRMEGTYGVIIVIIVIATLLNSGMRLVEKRVVRWAPPVAR